MSYEGLDVLQRAFLKGFIEGLEAFAHWKDGVQYVGTCGTTLKEAIADAKQRYAVQDAQKIHHGAEVGQDDSNPAL